MEKGLTYLHTITLSKFGNLRKFIGEIGLAALRAAPQTQRVALVICVAPVCLQCLQLTLSFQTLF